MNIFEFKLLKTKKFNEDKQKSLLTIKKSVNHGNNGTLGYVIKNGVNKGKVI